MEGRYLLHSVTIANEVVDETRRKKKEHLIFKVDYDNAYNSVSWDFILYMMRRMGFGEKQIRWIEEYLKFQSLSIVAL